MAKVSTTYNLTVSNPVFCEEWHPTKNGDLTPNDVTPGSGQVVWWTCKKGHDYAARVFVIKKTGITPLSNRAINYVYSSNNEVGKYWRSPFTKRSIDYVLANTKNNLNEWVTVKANVKDHFKKLHKIDVNEIEGVAIMTDTDNSKKLAIAYYQNIYFSSE